MKILALDIGDVWTGTALSDAMKLLAKPYQTIKANELIPFLKNLLQQEKIEAVVVGHPRTMKGTSSDQTKKVEASYQKLIETFPDTKFILWDERLSSKHADALKHAKTPEEKMKSHSIAAAFILQTYLSYLTPADHEEF